MTSSSPSSSASPPSEASQPPQKPPAKEPLLTSQLSSYFVAGGAAGAASRTVVSPLERLKIIQQVQPRSGGTPYKGVWRSLVRMWKEEGFKGYMRGNGINCVRIVPYSAVQFTAYEQLKKLFTSSGKRQLDTPTRLVAGALAGITSVCATYPLDLVRARLSIASASIAHAPKSSVRIPPHPTLSASMSTAASSPSPHTLAEVPGMWGMTLKVMREEGGIRALYRGMVPTAVGVAPYVGINFAAYEALRGFFTPPGRDHSAWRKLACGALAGSISQTLTYPFDLLRRKMQVTGLGSFGYQYTSAWDAIRSILRAEGVAGFYRGIWPNLLKVAPSIATSFYTYELVKEFLHPAT